MIALNHFLNSIIILEVARPDHLLHLKLNPVSEVAHQEIELLIEVGLEVKALHVALLDAAFFFRLQVHLVVALDTLAGARRHHRGKVLEHNTSLHVLGDVALLGLVRLHFQFPAAILN